jgi:hypothetical protein
MPIPPVESASTSPSAPLAAQTPRVVKCPTPQCPGWITLDSTRHQTEPCRYCRIGVDTLRFLLSRVGAEPENKALPARVHDWFNRLMLTMAGAWGQNVYLRPSNEGLVDLRAGQRGVIIEYNPQLGDAGEDGPAPLVGTILHKLLHFEAHLGTRPVQIVPKSGAREREGLSPLLSYLLTVTDHAWVTARLGQLDPTLQKAGQRWGLDVAQMLVGSESMFNRYLSERNLHKLVSVLDETEDAGEFREAVLGRLATLTQTTLGREREETRKIYLAIQLANVRLLNPGAHDAYREALETTGLDNLNEAVPMSERLYYAINDSPMGRPPTTPKGGDGSGPVAADPAGFNAAVESALKALGMANYFEVKS